MHDIHCISAYSPVDCGVRSRGGGTLTESGRILPPSRSTPRTVSAPCRWPADAAGSAPAPPCSGTCSASHRPSQCPEVPPAIGPSPSGFPKIPGPGNISEESGKDISGKIFLSFKTFKKQFRPAWMLNYLGFYFNFVKKFPFFRAQLNWF